MKRINIGNGERKMYRVGNLPLLETRSQHVQYIFGECGKNGCNVSGGGALLLLSVLPGLSPTTHLQSPPGRKEPKGSLPTVII